MYEHEVIFSSTMYLTPFLLYADLVHKQTHLQLLFAFSLVIWSQWGPQNEHGVNLSWGKMLKNPYMCRAWKVPPWNKCMVVYCTHRFWEIKKVVGAFQWSMNGVEEGTPLPQALLVGQQYHVYNGSWFALAAAQNGKKIWPDLIHTTKPFRSCSPGSDGINYAIFGQLRYEAHPYKVQRFVLFELLHNGCPALKKSTTELISSSTYVQRIRKCKVYKFCAISFNQCFTNRTKFKQK